MNELNAEHLKVFGGIEKYLPKWATGVVKDDEGLRLVDQIEEVEFDIRWEAYRGNFTEASLTGLSHLFPNKFKFAFSNLPITTPDHWAESVKMADEIKVSIKYVDGEYLILINTLHDIYPDELGPFTLPELHEKLISLRESEGLSGEA